VFCVEEGGGGIATRFPFGTKLPLGIFLDVRINPKATSPYALIETLCRSLARHHEEGIEGVVKAFEDILAIQGDEGKSAAGGSGSGVRASPRISGKSSASTPIVVAPAPLPLRIGAFFDCVAGALNMIWREGVQAKLGGADWTLPFPLLGALLEERCSLNTVDDLLITLAPDSPGIPRSAWGFTIACTAAEAALKKLGFTRESFDSVKGQSINLKTRMVAVWMEHGGEVPQHKRHWGGVRVT
jgi:hypothetical protein